MKQALKIMSILMMVIIFAVPVKAQFGIYGGVALPVSDFGSNDVNNSKAGSALLGYGGGIEYNLSIPPIFGWVTSLSFVYNDLDIKNIKNEDYSLDYTPWLTGWAMTGLRANIPVIPVYAQVQIGACIAKAPDVTYKMSDENIAVTSDPVAGLGISAGAGVGFGPFKIFARYMHAGDLEFEMKTGGESGSDKVKHSIDIVLVTAGIEF